MNEQHDGTLGVPEGLDALVGIVLGETDLDAVLQRTCEVAKSTIAGAVDVSVTLTDNGAPRTAAFSGGLALRVDESQYDAGYGPCLDAARSGEMIVVQDLAAESTRWPDYVPPALAAGIRASISAPLRVDDDVIGALNIYSTTRESFEDEAVRTAATLSRYAGIVLTNADHYYRATSMAEQLQQAMESRAVIEQAKGILMAQRGCSSSAAFDMLVRLSQQSHRKLREIAAALVEGIGSPE
ncbi:MAG: GAF and ANTAR domain-containing protein [Actinomycetes bacterium]